VSTQQKYRQEEVLPAVSLELKILGFFLVNTLKNKDMEAKPSDEYVVVYQVHDSLSQDGRYIEALTAIFEAAERTVLEKREVKS
jgi:hypothetical protein